MSMRRLTHEQYAKALKAAHPGYELLSQYVNARTKVLVRCIKHNEVHEVVAQSLTTTGQSMKCCGKRRQMDAVQKTAQQAMAALGEAIKSHGRLQLISAKGYKSQRSKVLCQCVNCGDQAMVAANNAKSGQGINCACRLQSRVEHGKKSWTPEIAALGVDARMAAGFSNPIDSVQNALTGDLVNNVPTSLYLYASPISGLAKYGIAVNPDQRAKVGGYGKQLAPHRNYASRVTAVLIEQAYRYGYGMKPPAELAGWCGRTELTDATPSEFQERIEELEKALHELGAEAFASEYTGYTA